MKKLLSICILLISYTDFCTAQNIFDYDHRIEYVKILKQEKNYDEALQEIQEIEKKFKIDTSFAKLYLSILPKVSIEYKDSILIKFNQFSNNEDVYNLLITNYILIDSISAAKKIIYSNDTTRQFYFDFYLSILLLERKYDSAYLFATNRNINHPLYSLILETREYTKKNKTKAMLFASIIPGSGKAYLRQYTDAITSFLTTATYGFLTYRTFNKNGVNSFFPWINGAAFSVFYIGNILGTGSAYDRYQHTMDIKIKKEIQQDIEKIYTLY